jgi:DNA-binding response OmpR family regulator
MAKILVIDDSRTDLDFVTDALQNEHEVVTADNWTFALHLIVKETFDLMLIDIKLPGLSGDKLVEALEHQLKDKPLNIVLFSGIDERELQRMTAELGVKGYIHKPCPVGLFSIRVNRFLR